MYQIVPGTIDLYFTYEIISTALDRALFLILDDGVTIISNSNTQSQLFSLLPQQRDIATATTTRVAICS